VSGGNHEAVQNRKGFLAQHLHEDSNGSSVQHGKFEQIQICDVFIDPIELAHVPDVFELKHHKWTPWIPFSVGESKHGVAFFPAVLAGEPAG
jgi:hypothetical protein